MASEQQMKDFNNARAVLKLSNELKNPDVKSLYELEGRRGILIKLINLAAYQQQQIEALYRAVQELACHNACHGGTTEAVEKALRLRAPEGEFPDIEDEDDGSAEEQIVSTGDAARGGV